MLSRRVPLAAVLAGLGVIAIAAAIAAPSLEVRSALRDGVVLEVSLVHAPALWKGVLVLGTGLPTLFALVLATVGIAHVGTHASRLAFIGAAGAVQLDIGLLRLAAWDVLGTGTGVAGTRFGLIVLGVSVGLMLLAAAAVRPSGAPSAGNRSDWTLGSLLPRSWRRSSRRPARAHGNAWGRLKRRMGVSGRSEWL